MSKVVQEKFEVRLPRQPEGIENTGWASDRSARVKKGIPGRDQGYGPCQEDNAVFYGSLPPGMNIEDQEMADLRVQNFSMGGETDISEDWNAEAVHKGFSHKEMRPTDDMYTREHNDAFYDEITVDGITGFLERNNMLDRS